MRFLEMLVICLLLTTMFAASSGNVISRNKREVNRCEGIKTVKHLPVADRHPFKCDKFIECAHGQEIEKSCNDSMHWSISKNACVDPDEGDCIPEWEFVAEFCMVNEDGDYEYLFDCKHFVTCSNNIGYVKKCSGDLKWDAKMKRCKYECVREGQYVSTFSG